MRKGNIKIVFFTITLLCAGILLFFSNKNENYHTDIPQYLDSYSGFNKETKINRMIVSSNTNLKEDSFYTTNNPDKNYMPKIENIEQNYNISYDIQSPYFVNIDHTINNITHNNQTSLKGLSSFEKISLKQNENYLYKNISADWSGKIILKYSALSNNIRTMICTEFQENAQNICHSIFKNQGGVL